MKPLIIISFLTINTIAQCNDITIYNSEIDSLQKELDTLYKKRNGFVKNHQWDELTNAYEQLDYIEHLYKYNLIDSNEIDSIVRLLININQLEINMRMAAIESLEDDPCDFKWKLNLQKKKIQAQNNILSSKLIELSTR